MFNAKPPRRHEAKFATNFKERGGLTLIRAFALKSQIETWKVLTE